jgi:hypothetical protein
MDYLTGTQSSLRSTKGHEGKEVIKFLLKIKIGEYIYA